MRILYIMPGVVAKGPHGPAELKRREGILQGWAVPGCEVAVVDLEEGPLSIESMAEEYLAVPGLLRRVAEAEREGWDAALVGCYGDPGLDACREIVRMPVLGPGECSMLVAASLSHRFSIVTVVETIVRPLEKLAVAVGVGSKLASVREAGVPVLELASDPDASYRRMIAASKEALAKDGADTLVLGCMSMAFLGVADRMQVELGVPVINPALVTLKFAEMLVQAGLSHSKIAYPVPPKPVGL